MDRKLGRFGILATVALLAVAPSAAAVYDIDSSHSAAQFTIRHLMISNVRGQFSGVTGTVVIDDGNPANVKIDATIDASTVDTREPKRDTHLKSPEFFDVAKFPKITFVSKKSQKTGNGTYKVTGDLTMHGVTKEVVLDVTGVAEVKDPWGNTKVGATGTTRVDRKDYGLTWNKPLEAGGFLVGDDVDITIDAELTKKKAEAPAGK
jgi:polyisoprenoid-binding protein YceI